MDDDSWYMCHRERVQSYSIYPNRPNFSFCAFQCFINSLSEPVKNPVFLQLKIYSVVNQTTLLTIRLTMSHQQTRYDSKPMIRIRFNLPSFTLFIPNKSSIMIFFNLTLGGARNFKFFSKSVGLLKIVLRSLQKNKTITPGGTRTHNLWIRSPTRYPLRHWGLLPSLEFTFLNLSIHLVNLDF